MIWNLTEELPQFRTKMFMNATSPSWFSYDGVNMKTAYYHENRGIVHMRGARADGLTEGGNCIMNGI